MFISDEDSTTIPLLVSRIVFWLRVMLDAFSTVTPVMQPSKAMFVIVMLLIPTT